MAQVRRESERSTLEHLVKVVKDLRRGMSDPRQAPVFPEPDEKLIRCVNCGYVQQGQPIDRCPECGLLWASLLHDPTCWSYEPNAVHWLQTAVGVLTWDRRTRVRTSLIPATPESARFARLCALISAMLLGLAIAVALGSGGAKPGHPLFTTLFIRVLLGSVFGYGVLRATLWVSRMSLQGVWRRELRFVPASIHYAAAWWPPLALILLFLPVLVRDGLQEEDRVATTWLVVLFGVGSWAFWMWASVSESGHVRRSGLRITFLVIGLTIIVSHFAFLTMSMSQAGSLTSIVNVTVGD